MSWQLSLVVHGASFRPSRVSAGLVRTIDVGELVTTGPDKGKPSSCGFGVIELPQSEDRHECLANLCAVAENFIPALRAAGAQSFTIWVVREFATQCNEELSAAEVARIAALGCGICYSAYDSGVGRAP